MQVEKLLITQLVNKINKCKDDIGLPCGVTVGTDTTVGRALWIQALGGTRIIRQYLRGKYLGMFPFAVYYRLSGSEINGTEAVMFVPHEQLSDWLDENHNQIDLDDYTVTNIEMSMQPTIYEKREDGTTVYKSQFNMTYKKER